jgi:hypothetical protein
MLLAIAISGTASAKNAAVDTARGSGTSASGSTFSFSATAGLNGEDATGTMTETGPTYTVRGEVRCLEVVGRRAVLKGVVTESDIPDGSTGTVGWTMYFVVEDHGKRGAGDRFSGWYGGTEDPCPADFTEVTPPPIASGDIVVTDCVALSKNRKHCARTRR